VGENIRRNRGEFGKIHEFPGSSGDVPDAEETRLVVLPLKDTHTRGKVAGNGGEVVASAAVAAGSLLRNRGNAPRVFQNALAFLAADVVRLQEVEDAVRLFLAWKSIVDESGQLDLTQRDKSDAERQRDKAQTAIAPKIEEAFCWLLAPRQATPAAAVTWD
jgi:hypothetical protein